MIADFKHPERQVPTGGSHGPRVKLVEVGGLRAGSGTAPLLSPRGAG